MNPQQTTEQETLQKRFNELPAEIMSVINDGTLDASMFTIKEAYELTDDQVRLLENEIILVLCFFASRSDFAQNISEALQLDSVIAEAIQSDVQSDVFDMVLEYIEAVENAEANPEQIQPQSTEVSKKASLAALAESFEKRIPEQPPVSEPTVPQESLATVTPLRTMKGDINRIHGYGAFNEAKGKDTEVT